MNNSKYKTLGLCFYEINAEYNFQYLVMKVVKIKLNIIALMLEREHVDTFLIRNSEHTLISAFSS